MKGGNECGEKCEDLKEENKDEGKNKKIKFCLDKTEVSE